MTSVALELFRHKAWATLQLIEFLRGLPDETLDATAPGTYGSIRATLAHIVNNEAGYYAFVTEQDLPAPLPHSASLDQLSERFEHYAPLWERLLDEPGLPERNLAHPRGSAQAVVPMSQAVHHGDVHRTHILSILGSRGLQVPNLDIWDYATSAGQIHPPTT